MIFFFIKYETKYGEKAVQEKSIKRVKAGAENNLFSLKHDRYVGRNFFCFCGIYF
jgi:hypothetical protein